MKYFLSVLGFIFSITVFSQVDALEKGETTVHFTGFADIYYFYDFNEPKDGNRQDFLYNHNRQNEFNLNLALFKAHFTNEKYRANIAFQSGTYAQDNYAAEEGVLQHVFEANIGFALDQKRKWWLDAGILPSHLGFESAISTENYTLSRSLAAESSPYFSSGAVLSYLPNNKWEIKALVLNGWQRIQRVPGNSMLSGGTQLVFMPNDQTTINWSTFIGTDDPDTNRRMRYFSNFFTSLKLAKHWGVIAGFDYGLQERLNQTSEFNYWYCPTLIVHYSLNDQWSSAVRLEYYEDEDNVIVQTPSSVGYKTTGLSVNVDYKVDKNLQCRVEARSFNSPNKLFKGENAYQKDSFFIGFSMALKIDH